MHVSNVTACRGCANSVTKVSGPPKPSPAGSNSFSLGNAFSHHLRAAGPMQSGWVPAAGPQLPGRKRTVWCQRGPPTWTPGESLGLQLKSRKFPQPGLGRKGKPGTLLRGRAVHPYPRPHLPSMCPCCLSNVECVPRPSAYTHLAITSFRKASSTISQQTHYCQLNHAPTQGYLQPDPQPMNATLYGKRDIEGRCDQIKGLKMGDYPGLAGWV